jgi:hypothetical protein
VGTAADPSSAPTTSATTAAAVPTVKLGRLPGPKSTASPGTSAKPTTGKTKPGGGNDLGY